jgi:hypothetical protein
MLSRKTTGNGSIQIALAEAGRLKVMLPYSPDRIAKKSLGLRSQSWQDTVRVLSSIARQEGSYTEPDNT